MTYRLNAARDFDPFASSQPVFDNQQCPPTAVGRGINNDQKQHEGQASVRPRDDQQTDRPRTRAKAFSLSSSMVNGGSMLCSYALRLRPGDELRRTLLNFVEAKNLKAAFVMSCVGSARSAKLRLANATSGDTNYVLDLIGSHEIVSLTGTLSDGGHLHASLADQSGKVIGGHLLDLTVMTTAEVVIGECSSLVFKREPDDQTGFKELVVSDR